jgi:general stress protein 26
MNDSSKENHTEKIHELLGKFHTAMLVTHGRDQAPHARPMAIAKIEPNCDLWFFTQLDSEKTREIEEDEQVMVVCQKEHSVYLSLVGKAGVVMDRTEVSALWKESYKVWFPKGIEDPNLALIRVTVLEAEFWDSSGFKGIKYLFSAARAYINGQTPEVDPDQHGHVAMR